MPEIRRRNAQNAEGLIIDDTNMRLLAELQADARLSLAELGRRVGLSSPAVAERLQRLEQEQVILGYHARLNPRKLGMVLTAVIRVRPAGRQLHEVGELAKKTPEVVDCRRITGDDCYIITAHVCSVGHLEEVIDRFAAYGQTTTSIVQSAPVDSRGLCLQGDGSDRPEPAAFEAGAPRAGRHLTAAPRPSS
jgi:Lrp/AsnC family transcriptional regulator, leucine-responsive regulatory protein